jgi:hypothetical protein
MFVRLYDLRALESATFIITFRRNDMVKIMYHGSYFCEIIENFMNYLSKKYARQLALVELRRT